MTELDRFEAECLAAGVSPSDAVKAGGLAASTWFRWKSQATSPTLRSLEAARQGLGRITGEKSVEHAEIMAPPHPDGAENQNQNVTRTNEPGSSAAGAAA